MLFIGKRAFIAGVADDNGYGWAIAKSLAAAGAEILLGTWVPVSKIAEIARLHVFYQSVNLSWTDCWIYHTGIEHFWN